jgi:hypothetical protein
MNALETQLPQDCKADTEPEALQGDLPVHVWATYVGQWPRRQTRA